MGNIYRWIVGAVLSAGALLSLAVEPTAGNTELPSHHCVILDEPSEPLYRLSVTHVPATTYVGHGRSGQTELDGLAKLAYFREVAYGDIELTARLHGVVFGSSAGVSLPRQVVKLAVDGSWTWRYVNDVNLRIRMEPGIYSDMREFSGNTIFVPIGCHVLRTFDSQLSGVVGLDVRSGFDQEVMPIAGIEWKPSDMLRVRARIPDSRVIVSFQNWSTYLGYDWQSVSYRLRDKGIYDRDLFTIEDQRYFWGILGWVNADVHVFSEIGSVFSRSVQFQRSVPGMESDIGVHDVQMIRVGVGGPF